MKKNLTLLLIFSFFLSFSQEYKLGKATIEELNETEHTFEKEAPACRIFSKGKTYMSYSKEGGFELITEVEHKIKIYKTEGLKYADFSVPYYNNDKDRETINFFDAATYNLVNGKVEKTKLKSEGEFTEKVSKYYSIKKITFPNVKVGSIIEFKYILKSPFLSRINDWNFQDLIPVNYSSFQTNIPEYFSYNPIMKGGLSPSIKNDVRKRTIEYSYVKNFEPGAGNNSITNRVNGFLEFNETSNIYELSNIPSISEESYVKNILNYISSVSHELASIKYPNEPFKLLSTSWEEVAKTINNSDNFGGELNKKGFFEEDINAIIAGKNTDEEKIVAIYEFVKNNFKWNGYYGIYTDEGLRSIYKNKTGNVADINLLLTTLLRHARINAHPVLISSVSNGIPSFPSRTAFNYVIAGVELNGSTLLLDATDKYALPNMLPSRAVNWTGRMIYQNGGSKEVDLQPTVLSKDNIIMNCIISNEGKVTGNVKRQLTNYNAFNYRVNYGSLAKESLIENIEKKYGNIEIDNYTSENNTNLNLPIIESFDFVYDKSVEIIGDKMFIAPMMFYGLNSNPFKSELRTYPIEFPFPLSDKYAIKIAIPDGYVIESLPKNENIVFNDKLLSHKYIVSSDEKAISIILQNDINTMILSTDEYLQIKEYFQRIVSKQTEKIVLKKNQ